jgi:nicotinate-nucleotide adenylyltransferase
LQLYLDRQESQNLHRIIESVRIALFGGTFDPVHYGHLRLAEEAREAANLERVLFVPANASPFRLQEPLSAPHHRLQMLRLATADNPAFEVSELEIQRGGVSYTIDTVNAFREQCPDAELFLILGADALQGFPNWYRAQEIAQACRLLVGMRPNYDLQAILGYLPEGTRQQVRPIPMLSMEISASAIRRQVRDGRSIRYLTPPDVIEYIQQHRLYLEP